MPKQGVHPFGKKPLPNGRVEWAISETKSLMAAARLLQVSYNTFKKYAKLYDLFHQNKNQTGLGISKGPKGSSQVTMDRIFSGHHPNYPHYRLQERLLREGFLASECSNCGFDDYRKSDMTTPLEEQEERVAYKLGDVVQEEKTDLMNPKRSGKK